MTGYNLGRYELTHAPMDADLTPHGDADSRYYEILKARRSDLDFLMPQFYNGYTRPTMGLDNASGSISVATLFSALSNDLFEREPHKVRGYLHMWCIFTFPPRYLFEWTPFRSDRTHSPKVVFGFCISDCPGFGVSGEVAVQIMKDLKAYNDGEFACNGGAFFWVALRDVNGFWSDLLVEELSATSGCSNGSKNDLAVGSSGIGDDDYHLQKPHMDQSPHMQGEEQNESDHQWDGNPKDMDEGSDSDGRDQMPHTLDEMQTDYDNDWKVNSKDVGEGGNSDGMDRIPHLLDEAQYEPNENSENVGDGYDDHGGDSDESPFGTSSCKELPMCDSVGIFDDSSCREYCHVQSLSVRNTSSRDYRWAEGDEEVSLFKCSKGCACRWDDISILRQWTQMCVGVQVNHDAKDFGLGGIALGLAASIIAVVSFTMVLYLVIRRRVVTRATLPNSGADVPPVMYQEHWHRTLRRIELSDGKTDTSWVELSQSGSHPVRLF